MKPIATLHYRITKRRCNYTCGLQKYILSPKPAGQATFMAARCYQALGQTSVALAVYRKISEQTLWPIIAQQARFERGWVELTRSEWDQAAETFGQIGGWSTYHHAAQLLADRSGEGFSLPRKDPTTAGVLSGFFPGAGQIYCNQPKDAALSFFLNGLFIFATIESLNQELYVLGGILALVESALYTGNIYNAVNHAHKYNRRQKNGFPSILMG